MPIYARELGIDDRAFCATDDRRNIGQCSNGCGLSAGFCEVTGRFDLRSHGTRWKRVFRESIGVRLVDGSRLRRSVGRSIQGPPYIGRRVACDTSWLADVDQKVRGLLGAPRNHATEELCTPLRLHA